MRTVTSRDILSTTGLQSIKTLTRWYQRGLIPEPTIGTHPQGRGKIAYWPEWVLGRCQRIRDLASQGMRLEEISRVMGCDWKAEASAYRRRYRLSEVSRRIDYDHAVLNLIDLVTDHIVGYLVQNGQDVRKPARRLEKFLGDVETVAIIVDHVKAGRNPILVCDGNNFDIVPDFIAGQLLADSASSGQVFVMRSIHQEASIALAKLIKDAPTLPTARPTCSLDYGEGDECTRVEFNRVGRVDYELRTTKQEGDGGGLSTK